MTVAVAPIARSLRLPPLLRELLIVLSAYFAYFAVRGATEGDVSLAMEHARLVERFERALGLFVEPSLQTAILGQYFLVDLANWVYVWGHWPVILVVAVWLHRSRPDGYRVLRNAFLISGAIGLLIFAAFPVAPPRLADIGLVDTVVERSNFYHLLQPPALTNQYAALPSLHFGWNLLIGIALMRGSTRRAGSLLGAALPLMMLAAVLLTGNHYVVDILAGGAIALIGLRVALMIQHRRPVKERAPGRITPWRSALVRSGGRLFVTAQQHPAPARELHDLPQLIVRQHLGVHVAPIAVGNVGEPVRIAPAAKLRQHPGACHLIDVAARHGAEFSPTVGA